VGDHAQYVCLYVSYAVAGSVGNVADRAVLKLFAAASRDHLRNQSPVSQGRPRSVSGR
jgi:lipoprotein signal peptidase